MRQVVVITGHTCTGKSGLAQRLHEQFGYHRVRTSDLVKRVAIERGARQDRATLQTLGDHLDAEKGPAWIFRSLEQSLSGLAPDQPVVIDSIRTWGQLEPFRSCRNIDLVHAHLYASAGQLLERFQRKFGVSETYDRSNIIKGESDIQLFRKDADVRIDTDFTDSSDTLVRVAARLGLYSPPNIQCVDVLIGGQYGSEGKGHVAAYLAPEYDVLVRVGGPNAGHTVSGRSEIYTYHQLPSGAQDTNAILLLGPGMTLHVDSLLKEIEDCGVSPSRLFIDPQAMVISEQDKRDESDLRDTISSTASGSGAAAARRIMGRGDPKTSLAKDVEKLRDYVGVAPDYRGSTLAQLELAYSQGKSILLEGTQGSGLSIFHGQYPHVTSRDTNVAGCLAEAGISPARVRRIMMVIRPAPIRVADPNNFAKRTSGRLKHETTFEAVAARAGLDPIAVTEHEKTSTTKRDRRVGWFEWDQFRNACALNAPTDIVLAFADYVDAKNGEARRFEQLTIDTIKFIEELERIAQAPVSLINTRFPRTDKERFDLRTIIDRRNWVTRRATPSEDVEKKEELGPGARENWRVKMSARASSLIGKLKRPFF